MIKRGMGLFHHAAGVRAPLWMTVRAPDGRQAQVKIDEPAAVIGRGGGCDISIPHESLSLRHVYLQAIGEHVACLDLFTSAGISVEGPNFKGWLTSQHTLRLGDWSVRLAEDVWSAPQSLQLPWQFRPHEDQSEIYGALPAVDLQLVNTSLKGQLLPIDRVVTLIGRHRRCRITLPDEQLPRVQCALLLLPSGLWVIDVQRLEGTRIDGNPCRSGVLSDGQELQIGRYRFRALYRQPPDQGEAGRDSQSDLLAQHETVKEHTCGAGSDFLTRQNKIFQVEFNDETVIVSPLGDATGFFYQEIHMEASRVKDLIRLHKFQHIVIDFSRVEGAAVHSLTDAMTAFCRSVPARALCGASARIYSTLKGSALLRMGQHYATRQEALQAVSLTGKSR